MPLQGLVLQKKLPKNVLRRFGDLYATHGQGLTLRPGDWGTCRWRLTKILNDGKVPTKEMLRQTYRYSAYHELGDFAKKKKKQSDGHKQAEAGGTGTQQGKEDSGSEELPDSGNSSASESGHLDSSSLTDPSYVPSSEDSDEDDIPPAKSTRARVPAATARVPADAARVPADAARVPADAAEVPADAARVPADAARVPADAAGVPAAKVPASSPNAVSVEINMEMSRLRQEAQKVQQLKGELQEEKEQRRMAEEQLKLLEQLHKLKMSQQEAENKTLKQRLDSELNEIKINLTEQMKKFETQIQQLTQDFQVATGNILTNIQKL